MTLRTRKLVGTVILLVFLIAYALTAMMAAIVLQVRNAGTFVEVIYYVMAGLAWVPPAAWVIWWMQRPDQPVKRN